MLVCIAFCDHCETMGPCVQIVGNTNDTVHLCLNGLKQAVALLEQQADTTCQHEHINEYHECVMCGEVQ